jgi:hypothetical protein
MKKSFPLRFFINKGSTLIVNLTKLNRPKLLKELILNFAEKYIKNNSCSSKLLEFYLSNRYTKRLMYIIPSGPYILGGEDRLEIFLEILIKERHKINRDMLYVSVCLKDKNIKFLLNKHIYINSLEY